MRSDVYSLPMRLAPLATTIGLLLGLLSQTTFARAPFTVSPATPSTYDDVEKDLEKIKPYLEESQCGGWQDDTVEGKISTVTGLPGRNGVWDGAILTGVSTRKDENGNSNIDDDFQFPQTTMGLTTACNPDQEQITKKIWEAIPPQENPRPGEIRQKDVIYPHPKFSDPACRWRPKVDGVSQSSAPNTPLKPLDTYKPAPTYEELTNEPENRQSPPNCMNLCKLLNSYQFYDCLETEDLPDPVNPTVLYKACKSDRWGNRFLCTDKPVKGSYPSCVPGVPGAGFPNAQGCLGMECRCQRDGGPNPGNRCIPNLGTKAEGAPVFYSYFRTYYGKYERKIVDKTPARDTVTNQGPVACYGFYDEFDPKKKQTQPKDRRCVINLNVAGMRDSQTGKGEYGQNTERIDRDPNDPQSQRKPSSSTATGDFDAEKDLWYLKLSGGFSLLNENVFSGSYNRDLTSVFLDLENLDSGQMRATEQIGVRVPFANGNFIRAFDDTGERSVVTWWQKQQSAVAAAMHPPIIRLILPTGSAVGIDADDPFLHTADVKILKPDAKHEERIEVQINATDDMLGAAIAYIKRTQLLHIQEELIPIIVPLGSATEFRAKAEAWCTWYIQRSSERTCDNAPEDVKKLIQTLERYAGDIERTRILRSQLAFFAAKLLALQQSLTKPLSDWLKTNITSYEDYLRLQAEMTTAIGKEWRTTQESYETFGSTTNMPWCMNQRFTMPVYSFLDEWLPARKDQGNRTAHDLPTITVPSAKDIVIDLSTVGSLTGAIKLPVLDPIQVRVTDFPSPPLPNEAYTIPSTYPDLPPVANILAALRTAVDSLPKPPKNPPVIPPINLPSAKTSDFEATLKAIAEIQKTVGEMNDRYDKFWKSIGPLSPNEPGQDDRNGIKQMKEKLECFSWDDNTCQHVEMDLLERFMRIGSRPLVFLREDYNSTDVLRGFGGPCIAEHDVCTPLHPEEGGEQHILQIIPPQTSPSSAGYIDTLRKTVRDAMLPAPVGSIPSSAYPRYGATGSMLLPPFDSPNPIDLVPPRSSSSSSL